MNNEDELYGFHSLEVLDRLWDIVSAQKLRMEHYLEGWPNT
jgi:hypothetical protein